MTSTDTYLIHLPRQLPASWQQNILPARFAHRVLIFRPRMRLIGADPYSLPGHYLNYSPTEAGPRSIPWPTKDCRKTEVKIVLDALLSNNLRASAGRR